MSEAFFIGIDVSKATLDVAILPGGETFTVNNDEKGFKALIKRLAPIKPELIVMEATGGLQNPAAIALAEAGLPVAIVNPRNVRHFAKALGVLAKTDALDAFVIARFAERMRPTARPLPDKEQRELVMCLTRRSQLTGMMTAEKNRLSSAPKGLQASIKKHISYMKKEVKAIDQQAAAMIEASSLWKAKDELLQSAPGVGATVSATLTAFLPELGKLDRKEIAALAGLAPINRDSGKFRGKRAIWGGRAAVRTMLYLAALAAIRTNQAMKRCYAKLLAKGKVKKVAIVACMRRLLTALNAMCRDNAPWSNLATGFSVDT